MTWYLFHEEYKLRHTSPETFSAHIERSEFFAFHSFADLCIESHYPCCTVNLPQGYPKFLSASFVRAGANGLAHALLMPAHVSTTLPSGNTVNVTCDTNYPFDNTLKYTISTSAPFNFHIRLPNWSSPHHTILILNNIRQSIAPDPHTGMISLGIPAGSNSILYTLAPTLRIVPRANDTVAIYHGALLYALDVGESTTVLAPTIFDPQAFHKEAFAPHSNPGTGKTNALPPLPHQAHSYEIRNTEPWNIAIDISTLKFHPSAEDEDGATGTRTHLPREVWSRGGPPSFFTGRGCQIEWPLDKGVPAAVPLAVDGKRKCIGKAVDVVLRPYGSLKVHMAELPVVGLGGQRWGERGG